MQDAIQAIEQAFQKAEQVFGRKFERAGIRFDIRGDSGKAGTAQVMPCRTIRLNPRLYRQNPSHIVNDTCPHEVAHLVAFDLYGREGWGHGPRWKNVMRALGQKPERCHNLVTTSLYSKPIYECGNCKKQVVASRAVHNRIKNNLCRLRNCKCGGNYSFVGSGHELLKQNKLTCRELPENCQK